MQSIKDKVYQLWENKIKMFGLEMRIEEFVTELFEECIDLMIEENKKRNKTLFKSAGKTTGALTNSLLKEQARQIFVNLDSVYDECINGSNYEIIKKKWLK